MYETPDGRRFIGRRRVVLGEAEGYFATLKTLEERNKRR
jgi:hypothetical protein